MNKTKDLSILILDDEPRITGELAEFTQSLGYRTLTADRPSTAFGLIERESLDIAIIDIKLPEYDGLEFIRRLRLRKPDVEVIVMSGHGDMDNVIEALRLGAFDYLKKPFVSFDLQTALDRVGKLVDAQRATRRYAELCAFLNQELAGDEDFIGCSAAMAEIRERITRAAAASSSPVLIIGESGTGKELVARRIHASSLRAASRFVAVNCAAIPRDIFESEFFGHERGAFTDAKLSREGLFRAADGGTLFLDEVSEVPLESQAKLLRAIEETTIRPIGSDNEYHADVRIVCATNQDLALAVRDRRFRDDLYYRLAVLEIRLPPLRERRPDIIPLAEYFLRRFAPAGMSLSLTTTFKERLLAYDYPGNIRELRNLMERAALNGQPVVDLAPADWPLNFITPNSRLPEVEDGSPGELNLAALEKQAIKQAMKLSGGVLAQAARLLGISRQALDRRLRLFQLR